MTEQFDRLVAALADRYTIQREIGAGGMATVYLAEDLKHHRKVALKVLRPELAAIVGAERFLKEIEVTAKLQHPNILPLFDSGEADTFLFYVMPLIQGESLRDKLDREKQLGLDDAVHITTSVAAALDYAHRQDVIHRDIKPENVLLHDGQALLADFGIALAVSQAGGGRLTETGLSLGTPHYMSPEQATGDRDLDARSDLYSLACMTYEMLTGDPPHTGSTAQAVIASVVTEEPRPLSSRRRTVPPHIATAVHRALAKLPADRFSTCAEFSEVLEGRRVATAAGGAGSSPRIGSRTSLLIGAVGAFVGALVAATAFLMFGRSAPERVEHWTLAALPDVDTIPIHNVLDISSDGTRLVYVAADPEGQLGLEVRALDQPVGTALPGTAGARVPRFSPDGARVAFVGPPGVVKWVDIRGGTPQALADVGVDAGEAGLCWGSDGYIYFSRPATDTRPTGISRVSQQGGSPEVITTVDSTQAGYRHICFQVLPSGRGILYGNERAGGLAVQEIAAYSFATNHSDALLAGSYGRVAPGGTLVYATANGVLTAAPFDDKTLEVTGPPLSLIGNLFYNDDYSSFALSNAGTLLYNELSPRRSRLAWVDRSGEVTGIDADNLQDIDDMALSRDGSRITVTQIRDGVRELWVFTLPEGPWTRLAGGDLEPNRPAWNPSGTEIAFMGIDSARIERAWRISADGEGPVRILRRAPIPIQDGEYSPDGKWFVYRQGPVGPTRRDILFARPDPDSAAHEWAMTTADEFAPTLSPDGRWLAYVSDASGREEIMVQSFPAPGRRVQVSRDGGFEPRWARSGRELFYRDPTGNLVAVDVRTGADFSVGDRRILFSTTGFLNDRNATLYDVAPDDQRFVFIQTVSGGENSLKLVRGFWRELETKMGN